MDLTAKEYLLLLSPLVALLICIITTIFNIHDRKKHFIFENNKLMVDLGKTILQGCGFIDDKYKIYRSLMTEISLITTVMQQIYDTVKYHHTEPFKVVSKRVRSKISEKEMGNIIEKILKIARENQTSIPQNIHLRITREYTLELKKRIDACYQILKQTELKDSSEQTELLNIVNEIIGMNDSIKRTLQDDFDTLFQAIKNNLTQ